RMGDDPRSSVTDRWGRVHGQKRLFIADGSLHVTNGGFNPVLTIYALAFRVADQIKTELGDRSKVSTPASSRPL
ncbi:MAG: GMC oxidoreductase, partial [Chthonomonadales bacterium]